MAPVKISYVVSFSSQDPKFPVENLLREDDVRPWLGCPRDRSRQLRVELQLERAGPIGYVDVGNCGCAFLQLEVGRSSWPRDRPYLTLLPSVALMTPSEAKLDQNRCGVRMFKEADFLALAVGQKWDRVRVTCSQPFNRHSRFGLSFLRLRTPLDPEHPEPPLVDPEQPQPPIMDPQLPPKPSQTGQEDAKLMDGPWFSSPAFRRTFFPERHSSSREEEQASNHLQQLERSAQSPARLSRPAQMVLSAARSRALRPRATTGIPQGDPEFLAEQSEHLTGPGSTHELSGAHGRPECRQRAPRSRSRGKAGAHGHRESRARNGDSGRNTRHEETGICPICSGHFRLDLLPAHASHCGEEDLDTAWPSSSLSGTSPDTWVSCPICQLSFNATEVEWHASTCGDPAGTPGTSS